jgi:uncharacterized repeat protein (TIGR04076 family)
MNDQFELYDLEVFVTGDAKTFVCNHVLGKAFSVTGENLVFEKNRDFSLYVLGALLPLLPAKQRSTHPNDWMTTDEYIACPDPHCGAQFKIVRTSMRRFSHSETTKVELPKRKTGNETL